MKIKLIISGLLYSLIFSQFSSNTLNGFGNNSRIVYPSSEAMGGMWLYNGKLDDWSPVLASSIYKTKFTMIAIGNSFEAISLYDYTANNHLIDLISFSFPTGKYSGFGVSLSPYARTGHYIEDEKYSFIKGTAYSSPLASKNFYNIKGGISKLSISFSKGLMNEFISLGFKWNILFGNQEVSTTTTLAEVIYSQDGDQSFLSKESIYNYEFNHFNAYSYELDSRFNFQKHSLSFLINLLDNFKIDQYESIQLYSIENDYSFDKIILDEFGVGYMYSNNDSYGIAAEIHLKNKMEYHEEIMLFDSFSPSKVSFHNGFYKIINNPNLDSWNSINFSTGYAYKIISFEDSNLQDMSFSLGFSITFNNYKNNVDLSMTVGSRQSIIETLDNENYYKINLAISSGDKWFDKQRRK